MNPDDPGVANYAKEFGLTHEQAVANLSLQEEISQRNESMIDAANGAFTSITMTNDPEGTVRIAATTQRAAEAMVDRYVEMEGPAARFEYVEASYSQSQVFTAQEEVAIRLGIATKDGAVGPGAESAIAGVSPAGEILVRYDDQFDRSQLANTGTAAGPRVRYEESEHDITTVKDSCAVSSCDIPLHGGLETYSGGSVCTIGFNATVGDDAKFLTAGHCSSGIGTNWEHNKPPAGSNHIGAVEFELNTNYMDAASVNVGDAFWEQSPMNSIFRRSSPELPVSVPNFAITSRAGVPNFGDWVCRSGATTGERCGSVGVVFAYAGQVHSFVVDNAKACGGDSGGPWYTFGGAAYGLHSSSSDNAAACDSQSENENSTGFVIRRAEQYSGVTTVTSGSRSPFGHLDSATRGPGYIRVQGWAVDPDILTPIAIRIVVDVTTYNIGTASVARPDVDAVYPLYDSDVGFNAAVTVGSGPNYVCAYAVNVLLGSDAGISCIYVP